MPKHRRKPKWAYSIDSVVDRGAVPCARCNGASPHFGVVVRSDRESSVVCPPCASELTGVLIFEYESDAGVLVRLDLIRSQVLQ